MPIAAPAPVVIPVGPQPAALRETWTADDYDLTEGIVRDVEYRDGLYATPAKVGTNPTLVGRHGTGYRRKTFGPGSFVLNLWLTEAAERWPEQAYRTLLRRVDKPYGLTRYTRGLIDGTSIECWGEIVQSVEPRAIGQQGMRMGLEVNVPGAFWSDTADTTQSVAAIGPYPMLVSFPAFAGATAPLDTLTYTLTGPLGDATLRVPETGEWMRYSGQLAAGQSLTADAATSTVTLPPGGTLDRFTYSGYRFLELAPTDPGVPVTVRVEATSGGAGASLRVSGRRRYFC